MKLIVASAVLLAPLAAAQPFKSYGPIEVATKYGAITFSNVTLWKISALNSSATSTLAGTIDNQTGTIWNFPEFRATFRCPGDDRESEFVLVLPSLDLGRHTFSDRGIQVGMKVCDPDGVSISMIRGRSQREEYERAQQMRAEYEAAEQQARLEVERIEREAAAAETKKQAAELATARRVAAKELAEEKARQAYLAKFPALSNGAQSVFVGLDRKCSEQFVQAMAMDGLEKRKRLADLITYCGFAVDAGTHAAKVQTDGAYCSVKMANGKRVGETGWVPCAWMHPPQ